MRILETKGDFILGQTSRDFVVINIKGTYENHSHFETKDGAKKCITLINKNIMPKSKFLRQAALRLLGRVKFLELREPKQKDKYYNKSCIR